MRTRAQTRTHMWIHPLRVWDHNGGESTQQEWGSPDGLASCCCKWREVSPGLKKIKHLKRWAIKFAILYGYHSIDVWRRLHKVVELTSLLWWVFWKKAFRGWKETSSRKGDRIGVDEVKSWQVIFHRLTSIHYKPAGHSPNLGYHKP